MSRPPDVRLEISHADDTTSVISSAETSPQRVLHINNVHRLDPNAALNGSDTDTLPAPKQRKTLRVQFDAMEDMEKNSLRKDGDSTGSQEFNKFRNNSRYRGHRVSLLGKPINFKTHRKDIRMRRAQAKIYNFLERPKDWISVSYHLFV